jgi:hypothetical protein
METVYTVCAAVGGTLLVCQFLLSVLGIGGHHEFGGHDVHPDLHGDGAHGAAHGGDQEHAHSWFISLLSFRALVAALTFFGLVGLAGTSSAWEQPLPLLVALAAAAGAILLVGTLMKTLHQLKAEGNVRIERAVGKSGTVYLTIPGNRAGAGKVTLNLQNRTVEYQAITADHELPTGAQVVVVGIVTPDTVEVLPAVEPERATHE